MAANTLDKFREITAQMVDLQEKLDTSPLELIQKNAQLSEAMAQGREALNKNPPDREAVENAKRLVGMYMKEIKRLKDTILMNETLLDTLTKSLFIRLQRDPRPELIEQEVLRLKGAHGRLSAKIEETKGRGAAKMRNAKNVDEERRELGVLIPLRKTIEDIITRYDAIIKGLAGAMGGYRLRNKKRKTRRRS